MLIYFKFIVKFNYRSLKYVFFYKWKLKKLKLFITANIF